MAKMTKAARKQAAMKGASTKKKRKELDRQITIRNLRNRGVSPQEIALFLGEDLKAIVKTLRLLSLSPEPISKGIGLGAIGLDTLDDLAEGRFFADPKRLEASIRKQIDDTVRPISEAVATTTKSVDKVQSQVETLVNQFLKQFG